MKSLLLLLTSLFFVDFIFAQENGQLENLGPNINTPDKTESYPCLSPDGKTLFFSRDINDGNAYDIYFSTLNPDNSWSPAKRIDELNNKEANSVFFVSPDGNSIYVRGLYENNPSVKGVSLSTKTVNGWSKPTKVLVKNVPESYWGQHSISLSSDKQTMILSLDADLFVSFLQPDNSWAEPLRLPTKINPSSYQYTPFLAPDNKTLYFSTGGHGGFGSNDIYKTTRLDDTWLNWSDPVNVGEPINTSGWESFFSLSAKGDYAYVYKLAIGNGDIFRIKLADKVKPQASLLVSGHILNAKTNKPLFATIRFENLNSGKKIGSASTNPTTGEYSIVLPSGLEYGIYAEADNYIPVNENMDLTQLTTFSEITKDLMLVPVEVGQKVRLNNIFFDVNKSELKEQSFNELNRVVAFLNEHPTIEIEIAGHTDNVGSDDANLKLSTNRANAVKQYLIGRGVSASRVTSKGYGKSKPIADNATDEGRQKNRRVEFMLLKVN